MRTARPSWQLTLPELWLFLAVALPVLAALLAPLPAVDLAYHVRAGSELLDTGRIPLTDTFTFTAAGQAWANQQWGAQAILAIVHRLGGWEGTALLRAVLVGLTFWLVLRACRARGASPRTAAFLTLAAFVVSLPALGMRPQLFGMALFAASLWVVAVRRERPGWLWALPALALVWANVHGSFFLAVAVAGFAWLEDVADRSPRSGHTLLVLAATAVATFVTPFGPAVWAYALGLSTNPSVTARISEWQPTSLRDLPGILFFVSGFAVAALLARRSRVAPWPTLLWLGFLFALGIYAARGAAWWPLGAAVAVAGLIEPPPVERVRRDARSAANTALAVALVVGGLLLLPWWRGTGLTYAPPGVTAALRTLAMPGDRLFNPQPWGSWLEWAVPGAPVFVDSRVELFEPAVWDDYGAVTAGLAGWQGVLDRRAVSIVVVSRADTPGLGERLAAEPGWREAFADDDGRVFLRADR